MNKLGLIKDVSKASVEEVWASCREFGVMKTARDYGWSSERVGQVNIDTEIVDAMYWLIDKVSALGQGDTLPS